MCAGQDGNAVVIFGKAHVQSSCTLMVGVFFGCDGQTESRGERLPQLGDVVKAGVKW
jgi:serine acetyltransferase